ncbi:hypothetical protein [Aquamicrobium sp.]|uniref:hypothetical protein n=1 Tax=Aquamicrobium sp. TaxID=1872579 RepID=UPI002583320C|nr:hypothetical protein [Aquamicrobium sp.]MCK9552329.1 DUF4313 domain-containing protein [Aquamicrobium sp.]
MSATKINIYDRELFIIKGQYTTNGAVAISLYEKTGDEVEPFLDLTTNIDGATALLQENEIFVKTWSENEPFIKQLLESGYFEDTGKRHDLGFVQAHIWKIVKEITDIEDIKGPEDL